MSDDYNVNKEKQRLFFIGLSYAKYVKLYTARHPNHKYDVNGHKHTLEAISTELVDVLQEHPLTESELDLIDGSLERVARMMKMRDQRYLSSSE